MDGMNAPCEHCHISFFENKKKLHFENKNAYACGWGLRTVGEQRAGQACEKKRK